MTDGGAHLELGRGVRIPESELVWRFTASGGPGGQHANTANTRAEVVFDIAGSPSLTDVARSRLLARLGPELRVVSTATRSQSRNRADALDRLRGVLAAALVITPPRRSTRPTRGAVERRLAAKQRHSRTKSARRRPRDDD